MTYHDIASIDLLSILCPFFVYIL